MQGGINHSGGLTFTHAGKTVTATNFVLNTTQRTLSATVNGKQVPLLAVDLSKLVRTTRDRLIVASRDDLDAHHVRRDAARRAGRSLP